MSQRQLVLTKFYFCSIPDCSQHPENKDRQNTTQEDTTKTVATAWLQIWIKKKKDTQAVNDKLFIDKICDYENEWAGGICNHWSVCVRVCLSISVCITERSPWCWIHLWREKQEEGTKALIRFQSLRHKRGRHTMKMSLSHWVVMVRLKRSQTMKIEILCKKFPFLFNCIVAIIAPASLFLRDGNHRNVNWLDWNTIDWSFLPRLTSV